MNSKPSLTLVFLGVKLNIFFIFVNILLVHTNIVMGHRSIVAGNIDSVLLYCIVLYCINEVTLRRARLVLGWVTVYGRVSTSVFHQATPRPTQPPTFNGTGNEFLPKCGDALRLVSKGRYGSFHLWINVWVAGKSV